MRGLPLESLAPVGLLFVAGLLLLGFGQRLLKPVLVVAAIFGGVVIAVRVGPMVHAGMSPLAWSCIGALAGVVAIALSYRIALGLAVASIGAVAAILVATTAAECGLVDVGSHPKSSQRADANVDEDSPSRPAINDPLTPAAAVDQASSAGEAMAQEIDRLSPSFAPTFRSWLDRTNTFLASVGDWAQARWDRMPKPMRTLLLASAALGAFLGFAAGVSSPTWAAATITSLFGSLLVLGCGVPLASRVVAPESMPALRPLGWLLTWLGLAFLGLVFQWWTRPADAKKQKGKDSAQAQPA